MTSDAATEATARRPSRRARTDFRTILFNRICTGVLLAFALLWIVPLAWAVDTAFKPESETTKPATWWIENPTIEAFTSVLFRTEIVNWYVNGLITATVVAALTVLVASMAGFALSRIRFRGRRIWFWFILAGIMIPPQALIVPLFREFEYFNLLNTYWAVILPQVPTAVAVFVFKQFFDGLPHELEDAAYADGANRFHVFWRIFLPLSKPAMSAVAIFSFVWAWNNFLWPLLVLTDTSMMTIPVGLATVQSAYGISYAQVMASAVLGALPLLFVFLVFQRQIVQGIAGTGLK